MWVGAYRTGPGNSFAWEDGSPWDYENWSSGQPDNNSGFEDGVLIDVFGDGTWVDFDPPLAHRCLFMDTVSK